MFVTENAGEHNNCIILLDEPGHTLHPMAQRDLAMFFNSLAEKNQLIYTTHSPFLVDPMNITRTKVVFADQNGKTNISDNLKIKKNAQKSIYPINSAIGITISDTMLIGTKPIIVEGVSDQIYLTYIKRQLMKQKDFNLEKELIFMPVDGTKNIKPVVAIITGKEEELPVVLLDADVAGKEKKKTLEKNLYKDNKDKLILVSDFLHTKVEESEIEDLMDYDIIVEAVNREFHSDIEDFEYDNSSSKNIIQQIENYAKENDIILNDGWKVKIAQRYVSKERKETTDIHEKWKDLFEKFINK